MKLKFNYFILNLMSFIYPLSLSPSLPLSLSPSLPLSLSPSLDLQIPVLVGSGFSIVGCICFRGISVSAKKRVF
jgi:hypothetical protein